MVEQIEELGTDQDRGMFGNAGQLVQPEIRVVPARAVEETPAGVADGSQGLGSEGLLVEVTVGSAVRARIPRILNGQRTDEIRLVHSGRAGQRAIAALCD